MGGTTLRKLEPRIQRIEDNLLAREQRNASPFRIGWLGGKEPRTGWPELDGDMVAMDAAIYEALKGDPKFSSLSPAELSSAEDRACAKHPGAKAIDALRADN